MATLRQDLGPVTAYAYAVSEGYTGTEEEYAELMASYATVAEAAAGSASDAADSASDAEAYGAGTRGGSAVESGDEAYHNNAKYYAESAADDASTVASAVNSFINITAPAAVQSVTDEGTTQIGLVQGEGTTQIGLVSGEGTTQVGAVAAKGAEVLESIPEDYTELSDDVSELKSALSVVEAGNKKFTTSDIIQGSYDSYGNVYPNSNIIRIQGFVELQPGDTLSFKPGTNVYKMLYGTFNENKVFQSDSQWYTSEHTIAPSKHIYVVCVFKNEAGTAIVPSDFDATVIKSLSLNNDINNINDMLSLSVSPSTSQIINNRFIQIDGDLSPETSLFKATDYLNIEDIVTDNVTVSCTVYGNAGLAFYDSTKTLISAITGNNASTYGISANTSIQTFTIPRPNNAAYMRLSAYASSYSAPSNLKINGFGFGDLNGRLLTVEREIESIDIGTLYDKKVLVLGDSISADAYGNYSKWVTDLINIGFFNSENVTNISQHATGYVARYDSGNNRFIDRLSAVPNKETYDLVVIYGGTNDYIQNIPMGTDSSDEDTDFIPAVRYLFNYAIENFTQARICVISPTRTYATWVNQQNHYETDYFDKVREIAKEFSYPVLNLTEQSGFAPYNTTFRNKWSYIVSGYDYGDGVHPNEEYERKYLAPMIKGFLHNLL